MMLIYANMRLISSIKGNERWTLAVEVAAAVPTDSTWKPAAAAAVVVVAAAVAVVAAAEDMAAQVELTVGALEQQQRQQQQQLTVLSLQSEQRAVAQQQPDFQQLCVDRRAPSPAAAPVFSAAWPAS